MRRQIRAKAVLGRDLEELQAKQFALENPPKPEEEITDLDPSPVLDAPPPILLEEESQPIKQEKDDIQAIEVVSIVERLNQSKAPPNETQEATEEASNIPPNANERNDKPVGLGINTTMASTSEVVAPNTAEIQSASASIDALFDGNDNSDSNLNFDTIDFSMHDSANNTQTQDQSQTQNTEFDLSTFGNNSQDLTMSDMQQSNDTNTTQNTTTNKQTDLTEDLFNMGSNNASGEDNMDMNNINLGIEGAEDNSVFNDIYFGEDDESMGGGNMGDLEHGEFDNAFFMMN